ncbi:MAG: hypothetical protein J6B85_10690 [Lachnospiraceae bacterium]|nr:hypothetical protein [Lachnospiraceae bacterium]
MKLDDRTLIDLIGGIALDLLEGVKIERDLLPEERTCAYSVAVFRKGMDPAVKAVSGIAVGLAFVFGAVIYAHKILKNIRVK